MCPRSQEEVLVLAKKRFESLLGNNSMVKCILVCFVYSTSSLPPLDWPLPTHFGQCELKIEVQPKTHHRAHYETEGSRGAVKASTGGHPIVKV